MSLTLSRWPAVLVLCLIASASLCRDAAAESTVEETMRYEIFTAEGSRFRFDKKTGDLFKLEFHNAIPMWVKQDVRYAEAGATAASTQQPAAKSSGDTQPAAKSNVDSTCVAPTGHATPTGPVIQIFDDENNDVTPLVSDGDRKNATAVIAGYENKLSILQTVKVGDKIEGTIMVRNSGEKRLRLLELTLSLNVNGKEKPEEHRLLFVEKKGNVSPPQPSTKGADGAALMRVNIPCPAGGVKGSPELKLTYLQFAD
jgi:hypothetical protein